MHVHADAIINEDILFYMYESCVKNYLIKWY